MTETTASNSHGAGHNNKPSKAGFFAGIALFFFRQMISELKKVVTPTRSELVNYTLVVIGFVVLMMLIISGLDFVFGNGSILVFTNSPEQ